MISIIERYRKSRFLFEELVKRDFKKKYKRTALGIIWSLLSPLFQLLVLGVVFTHFFGRDMPHFTIYLFAGNLLYSFFRDATGGGMQALMANADVISKVNVSKHVFLLSKNVSSLINFSLSLAIFFIFVIADGIAPHPRFFLLIYPIITLTVFNVGVGLILSALFVFFKDIEYLYDIFTLALLYVSAIFYPIESFAVEIQRLFFLNPVFTYIHYFRLIVLYGLVPSINVHAICAFYALAALVIGGIIYKKCNYQFAYYM